ncbi:MAG: 2-dehydro-3-deoxygalactonokinase [Bacillota bacterium]|jgi:2-dehydro-3-deoxygalactonokinase
MYFATIDCGTTNSRVYILNGAAEVIYKGTKQIGVKDTAVNGSNEILKTGLKELFENTVREAGLSLKDIKFAITSGMITSEIGLKEIPHLWAPAGIAELAAGITPVQDRTIFPVDVPLLFIRGIKNSYPANATYREIRMVDFMRGEETQLMGLVTLYPELPLPFTAVTFSSHTKYFSINAAKQIVGSLTTISGQLFEAIKERTFVGKSIAGPDGDDEQYDDYFDPAVVEAAYDAVLHAGFLRALMMPRFMEVLLNDPWYIRRLFIDATIIAEDLRVLNDFNLLGFPEDINFVLVGYKQRCRIFKYLLQKYYGIKVVQEIVAKDQVDLLNIRGAVAIAAKAGYLNGKE